MATGMLIGGEMKPPPSPPCTDMTRGGCAPQLQVCSCTSCCSSCLYTLLFPQYTCGLLAGPKGLLCSQAATSDSYAKGNIRIGHLKATDPRSCSMLVLQADEDSLMVSYSFPPAVVKQGSYASLVACYSTESGYDRAWRKPNPTDFTVCFDSTQPCLTS